LSHTKRTSITITDPLVIIGAMPATIELDFQTLLDSDSTG